MPTVLRLRRLRVVIYPNDHRPAHVLGNGCEAVFDLHCPNGPPEVRENYGFKIKTLTRIKTDLAAKLSALCGAWESIHGEP